MATKKAAPAPAKKAAATATKTAARTAAPARAAAATVTERNARPRDAAPGTYDARAGRAAARAERVARANGEKLATKAYTVMPGRNVRQAGLRYAEGETVKLTEADAARMIANGTVAEGADAKEVKASLEADAAAVDADHPDSPEAIAQREKDEAAAAQREADNLAQGMVSGAENH